MRSPRRRCVCDRARCCGLCCFAKAVYQVQIALCDSLVVCPLPPVAVHTHTPADARPRAGDRVRDGPGRGVTLSLAPARAWRVADRRSPSLRRAVAPSGSVAVGAVRGRRGPPRRAGTGPRTPRGSAGGNQSSLGESLGLGSRSRRVVLVRRRVRLRGPGLCSGSPTRSTGAWGYRWYRPCTRRRLSTDLLCITVVRLDPHCADPGSGPHDRYGPGLGPGASRV